VLDFVIIDLKIAQLQVANSER